VTAPRNAASESPPVTTATGDRVAVIAINRPHRMNALDTAANRALREALAAAADDDSVWVIIITGVGDRAFCAGADLKESPEALDRKRGRLSFGGGLTGVEGRRIDYPKPLIAAVNGYALGGGFELAMCCDIIVASENATFGIPEARVGRVRESPVVHRAIRHLPHHIAMGLLLTGRALPAVDAFRYGLVNEVVPGTELMATAHSWASDVLSCPPLAVRALKEAAIRGLDTTLDQAVATRWETIEDYQASDELAETLSAQAESREPHWTGRS
jgi:enoyl-CoA hydratase/carnithine racemase